MKTYTIRYVDGYKPGIHVTTIKANSEDEANDLFYKIYPKCAIVY